MTASGDLPRGVVVGVDYVSSRYACTRGRGSGSHAYTSGLNPVGEEKISQRCFVDEIQEIFMVGGGPRGAALGE